MLKKSIICLVVFLSFNLFSEEINYIARLKEFKNKLPNEETELEDLIKKYGEPSSYEIIEANETKKIWPNSAIGSKMIKYFFKETGSFTFFYNGESKKTFLIVWILEMPYLVKMNIPMNRDKIQEYFGEGNVDDDNELGYWGYSDLFFKFENNNLTNIIWSYWD